MILVLKYANELQLFLQKKVDSGIVDKFKIFVRIGFQLDAYIFTDCQDSQDIESDFFKYIADKYNKDPINPQKTRIYFNILPLSELEDSYYSSIVSNANTIDYGPRHRLDSLLIQEKAEESAKLFNKKDFPPIITFYSYKGGMGRTTTMFSYALHLAKEDKRVLIIDCDLEAPGYLNFFGLSENEQLEKGEKNGLVEFLSDTQFLGESEDIDIDNYILNFVQDKDNNTTNSETQKRLSIRHREIQNIWVMPAGNLNDGVKEGIKSQSRQDYLEGLAKLNLGNIQSVAKGFISLFKLLKNREFDAILIDSRTGFNDIFGTVAFYLSSCVVGFFGLSRQTEPGFVNLLAEHSQHKDIFKLILAFSILPNDVHDISDKMQGFIDKAYPTEPPIKRLIHRNAILEKIGTGDDEADEKFIEMSTTSQKELQFSDYSRLFEEIDNACFHKGLKARLIRTKRPKDRSTLDLRNIVLNHLKKVLDESTSDAETDTINEDTFFYRKCMSEFFDKDKFIICGRKGTGKTHLCKSLQNNRISSNIKKLSNQNDESDDYIFINATPQKKEEKFLLTDIVKHSFDKDFIFFNFWRIYIWTKLLRDDGNESLSIIRNMVKQRNRAIHAETPSINFEMPYDREFSQLDYIKYMNNVDVLLGIIDDLHTFNELLNIAHKKVFILFDGLESYIHPLYWNNAILSLYDYCAHPENSFSSIIPRIFIRTDLLPQIEALKSDSIISMEWSTEEVFSYFFKLIFSDSTTNSAYWNIAKDFGIDSQYIAATAKYLETNNNQFKVPSQTEIEPLLQVVFGKDTNGLGRPWDYFKKELSNADYTANPQLFINIFRNAVDKALSSAESNITEIISPRFYTSENIRKEAANELFENLVKDPYCKALAEFQYVVFSAQNGKYRYKSLDGNKFEALINETATQINPHDYGHNKEDLINMIFANGIMTANQTTKGKSFVFAPLYWFPWGLQDDDEDPDLKKVETIGKIIKDVGDSAIGAGFKEFGVAATAVGSAVNMATDIAKLISNLSKKK